jgi:hypothetical protein
MEDALGYFNLRQEIRLPAEEKQDLFSQITATEYERLHMPTGV